MVFRCPLCGKSLQAPEQYAGRVVKCPHCGRAVQLPAAEDETPRGEPAAGHVPAGPPAGAVPPLPRGGGGLVDFLLFRRMVAPTVIIVLFYLLVGVAVLGTLAGIAMVWLMPASPRFTLADRMPAAIAMTLVWLVVLVLQVLGARVVCELFIVVFRMHETLTDMRKILRKG